MVISIQVLSRCSKLFYIPKPYYNYYYNMNSMTNMPTEDQCFIRFNQMKTNVDCLTSALSVFDLSGKTQEGLIYLKYKALSLLIPIIHKRKYYNVWMSTYKGLYKSLLPSKHIAFNIKIKFLLTALRLYPIYKYSLKSDFEANR